MICFCCLYRATVRKSARFSRTFGSSTIFAAPQLASANVVNTSQLQPTPPAITSTTAAQTLSTTLTSSQVPSSLKAGKDPPKVVSSVAAGTALKGLNYFKNKSDPVAMEDHEYPEWLWTILDEKKRGPADGQKEEVDPRLFSKSANARRMANKRARKLAKQHPESAVPQVPLHEQSVDLPIGEDAKGVRHELTKSMRSKRRRDIKEANFLKSMS